MRVLDLEGTADGGCRTHTPLWIPDLSLARLPIPPHRLVVRENGLAPIHEPWRNKGPLAGANRGGTSLELAAETAAETAALRVVPISFNHTACTAFLD